MENSLKLATFAGGCFWCMVQPFARLPGVTGVVSGYTGGRTENPTYEEVSSGRTGHFEAVQVSYNPSSISYERLLDTYWKQIDPTDITGQFADKGSQYKTVIFYHDEEQRRLAEASKARLQASGKFEKPIATTILPAKEFYPAEEYHQDYHEKNPERYERYKSGSGRKAYLERTWGNSTAVGDKPQHYNKPSNEIIKQRLNPLQYKVTQENATEPPFQNEYWDNKRKGIYVDVVSGEPLFSSLDKFESGCGWPSFTKPIEKENLVDKADKSHFMIRTEVRSKHGDSHLGHVFTDGPQPTGLRYCINSAATRFIPLEDMEKEGYKEYVKLFE